MPSTNISRRS